MKHILQKIRDYINQSTWYKIGFILVCIISVFSILARGPHIEFRALTTEKYASIHIGKSPKATWKRVGPGILRFYGEWSGDGSSTEQLRSLLQEPVNLVRITASGGGETSEAIANAELLMPFRPRMVIEDICGSSCANYLLPVASQIDVRSNAVIGYHGTVCEVLADSESCRIEQAFWQKLPNGDRISELPLGLRSVKLPLVGVGWMPMKEDFERAGYPPMTFDWYPEPYKSLPGGIYVAPIPQK